MAQRHGLLLCCLGAVLAAALADRDYLLGTGKYDMTGPAADVAMMGYAMPQQIVGGMHTRLYARAFIVAEAGADRQRFVFVNLDACMGSQLVTMTVLSRLKVLYGDLYTESNVVLSGTHTHSGPGGYLQYVLYNIPALGFVQQTFDAQVDGIVQAITLAHNNMRPGSLQAAVGEVLDGNINRSPTAYLNNPPAERALYHHDTDKNITLLKAVDDSGRGLGMVAWYAVHCTSINNTNQLISGDNKGVASQMTEKWAHAQQQHDADAFETGFVAAFGQSNVGDTSPNTQGAFCADTGLPCELHHSTCHGYNELCIGRGPAWPDNFKSNKIIAGLQAAKAQELWASASQRIQGPVDFRHKYLDMRNLTVAESNWTRAGRTCPAAMGFSFAAGTTDGPGAFDFKQEDTHGNVFWRLVASFLKAPSADQVACHAPKPILLDTGELGIPYAWQPAIVEISIMRAGQFVILAVPGEFTTMAGRRLRNAVRERVGGAWGADLQVVIAGLANTYSSYVTTFEEYAMQRYEGASTLYGPHTLDAYIQEFLGLADAMLKGEAVAAGPSPPNLYSVQWSLLGPVVIDTTPAGVDFGAVVVDVAPGPLAPGDTASVTFQSACPRNNMRLNDTFLTVERQDASGAWAVVHTDNDVSTKFAWQRPHTLSSESTATITWDIPTDAQPGAYRIRHFGDHKHITGDIHPFSGTSGTFTVAAKGGAAPRAPPPRGWRMALRCAQAWLRVATTGW